MPIEVLEIGAIKGPLIQHWMDGAINAGIAWIRNGEELPPTLFYTKGDLLCFASLTRFLSDRDKMGRAVRVLIESEDPDEYLLTMEMWIAPTEATGIDIDKLVKDSQSVKDLPNCGEGILLVHGTRQIERHGILRFSRQASGVEFEPANWDVQGLMGRFTGLREMGKPN